MGLIAARRAAELYENVVYVLSFELLCGVQAAEIRDASLLSNATKRLFLMVREIVSYLSSDQCLTEYLQNLTKLLKTGKALKAVEQLSGKIRFKKSKFCRGNQEKSDSLT